MIEKVVFVINDYIGHPDVVGDQQGCYCRRIDLLPCMRKFKVRLVDVIRVGDVVDKEPAQRGPVSELEVAELRIEDAERVRLVLAGTEVSMAGMRSESLKSWH